MTYTVYLEFADEELRTEKTFSTRLEVEQFMHELLDLIGWGLDINLHMEVRTNA